MITYNYFHLIIDKHIIFELKVIVYFPNETNSVKIHPGNDAGVLVTIVPFIIATIPLTIIVMC